MSIDLSQMSDEQKAALLGQLKADLGQDPANEVTFTVTAKGGVTLFGPGFGRGTFFFPEVLETLLTPSVAKKLSAEMAKAFVTPSLADEKDEAGKKTGRKVPTVLCRKGEDVATKLRALAAKGVAVPNAIAAPATATVPSVGIPSTPATGVPVANQPATTTSKSPLSGLL